MLILALACVSPDPETAAPVNVLGATCAADPDNALRATCRVELSGPGELAVEVSDGEETAAFTLAADAVADVPIWGLTADTDWAWTATAGGAERSGSFRTGPLPDALLVDPGRTGAGPSTLVQVLAPFDCAGGGWVTVLDAAGRPRWYADTGTRDVDMVQFTEDATFVLVADRTTLVELDLAGRDRLRKDDFGLPVHHDVLRRNGKIWTLLADAWPEDDGNTYVEEIVVALDDAGDEVWRWQEHDHLDATAAAAPGGGYWDHTFPGAIDAWHTNGLYVTDGGDVILSLLHEGSLLELSSADGSISWVLGGGHDPSSLPSSFALTGGDGVDPGFSGQHDPGMAPNGDVTVFDNDRGRGVELALDPSSGTATLVGAWDPALSCPVQSSLFALPGDHRLVTCADQRTMVEYDAAGVEVGRMAPTCDNGEILPRMARGQPVDLWGGVTFAGVTATRRP
jgi:hypothetical protein